MAFVLPEYREPDFQSEKFQTAPVARFVPAPEDGVVPEGFHATSNFPEYVQVEAGVWALCRNSRMDCALVWMDGALSAREPRSVRGGDPVLVGRRENGEDGIYVHTEGFPRQDAGSDKFQFRTRGTRESPFSKNYDLLYDLLRYERDHGTITWVLGPAVAFDRDSRNAVADLIENGYCHGIAAGNALATHDLEAAVYGTALGQDIYHQSLRLLGHYHHLDIINAVRRIGSLDRAVRELGVRDGIVHSALRRGIPLVLAGSIRDDGPLPGVIGDVYRGQDEMRRLADGSTTVLALATQLHSIAFGNMLPSYRVTEEGVRPVYLYVVDISEFAVDKLANRGTTQAVGISTNVQDFCVNLHRALLARE